MATQLRAECEQGDDRWQADLLSLSENGGLLRSEAKSINDYLANQPVTVLDRWDRDGIWHTLLGKTGIY